MNAEHLAKTETKIFEGKVLDLTKPSNMEALPKEVSEKLFDEPVIADGNYGLEKFKAYTSGQTLGDTARNYYDAVILPSAKDSVSPAKNIVVFQNGVLK